jgi:hypothetical protein
MSKKNGRTPPTNPQPPAEDPESRVDEVPLDETSALAIQLGQSRLNEAQLAVQLRQREMQSTLDRVRARYEEGGKYAVQGVNFEKMVVTRIPVEKREEPAPTTPPSTPSAN